MYINLFSEYTWSPRQARYILVRNVSVKWTGPVCRVKGASATQDQLQTAEANYYTQAVQQSTSQFNQQQAVQTTLQNAANQVIAKGASQQGWSPEQMNTMNAGVIQNTGQQYANAARAIKESQATQGGGTQFLPSGANTQINAQLASSAANQVSSGLYGNLLGSYQAGNQNYINATNSLMGVGELTNAAAFSNAASGAAGQANTIANQVQQADQQATNNIMGLATGAMGAAGSILMGKCWVAAELYDGWKDPRTVAVRRYIFGEYSKTFFGNIFAKLYLKYGRQVAKHIKTHPISRWFAQKIFDRLLLAATNKDKQVKHVSLAH